MKILFIGDIAAPSENEFQIHYSIYKTFGIATGFSEIGCEVYYMSKKIDHEINNIRFIPYSKLNNNEILKFDFIIFGLEMSIRRVISTVPSINLFIEQKKNNVNNLPKLIIKQTSHNWISKLDMNYDEIYRAVDFFFCQEKGFADSMKKINKDPLNKIYYSEMGVPSLIPDKSASPFFKKKYNLIYMGRLMHSPSKMPFLINVMKELGNDFHLNILPGSFAKPKELLDRLNGNGKNKFGSDLETNYQWLVDYFKKTNNITVHRPVAWGEHWNYLKNSDLGLDLSPSWHREKSVAGNAKLLEYLAAGLPVITEIGTGNSNLILENRNFGIIVDEICNLKKYTSAIKKILSLKYDRAELSKIIIKNNSWNIRAKQMLEVLNKR